MQVGRFIDCRVRNSLARAKEDRGTASCKQGSKQLAYY